MLQRGKTPTRHEAPRLLCVPRQSNKTGLSGPFGITINHHDYDAYWDSIIERICESKWWNWRRPKAHREGQVWDGQAAFLDAIYYVPVD
jgi:hypothetical protein